jgi:hypothetical protein
MEHQVKNGTSFIDFFDLAAVCDCDGEVEAASKDGAYRLMTRGATIS